MVGRPVLPQHAGLFLAAGGSANGSHGMRTAFGCPRQFWLSRLGQLPPASDGSGRVSVYPDPECVVLGPVSEETFKEHTTSVYMDRGSLVHFALAHMLIQKTIARDGAIVIAGARNDAFPKDVPWYSPEEAVECGSANIGPKSYTYALPAGRRLLGQLESWVEDLMVREQPVAVETQLAWHIPGPWIYTARFDLITRNRASGLYRGWDYKTASRPQSDEAKYRTSAQLHGQNEMGRRWAGDYWGGVVVVLIEDTNDPKKVGRMIEWALPQSPMAHAVGPSVAEAQQRMLHYYGKIQAEGIRAVPGNPFFCTGCQFQVSCY